MATENYTVLREHEGDRMYKQGDTRQVDAAIVKHLVDLGVLAPSVAVTAVDPAPVIPVPEPVEAIKSETLLSNKAERRAPANKTVG